jgi:hypothetical protein
MRVAEPVARDWVGDGENLAGHVGAALLLCAIAFAHRLLECGVGRDLRCDCWSVGTIHENLGLIATEQEFDIEQESMVKSVFDCRATYIVSAHAGQR